MGHVQQSVVGELLRSLRQRAGLNQSDVADRLSVPQSFVSKYESGERKLDLLEVRRVCIALEISLGDFARLLEDRLGQSR